MVHISSVIRSLRNQARKLSKGSLRRDRAETLQKVVAIGLLSERIWGILYRSRMAEPENSRSPLASSVNDHAIRRVAGANRLMEAALADDSYYVEASSLRRLLAPPVALQLAPFRTHSPEDLAHAKRVNLALYRELASAARKLECQKIAAALDEILAGERQGLKRLLDSHVTRDGGRTSGRWSGSVAGNITRHAS